MAWKQLKRSYCRQGKQGVSLIARDYCYVSYGGADEMKRFGVERVEKRVGYWTRMISPM